jgi:hypothetical protein
MEAFMSRDEMLLESPAAQAELMLLKTMKVGDVRRGILLPALEVGVEWTCTTVDKDSWTFDGTFFGQPLFTLVIRVQPETLTLEVRG